MQNSIELRVERPCADPKKVNTVLSARCDVYDENYQFSYDSMISTLRFMFGSDVIVSISSTLISKEKDEE